MNKKINSKKIPMLLTSAIFIGISTIQANAADIYKVTYNSANIRNSNTTSSKVVSKVYLNEAILVSDIKGKWAKIDNNKYISTSCIAKNTSKYEVTSRTSLAFRVSPSKHSGLVKDKSKKEIKIKRNTLVDVISINKGWAKINYNNKQGYVEAKYLSIPTVTYKVTASNGVNVRSEANTNSKIVGKIQKGMIVNVLHATENWAIITYNGERAYIGTKYIEKLKLNKPKKNFAGYYYVNYSKDNKINVRDRVKKQNTGTTGKIIGKLNNGQKVKVLEVDKDRWAKIEYKGNVGYCYFNYLSSVVPTASIQEKRSKIIEVAIEQLGKKYEFGSEGLNTFDCSSFAKYVYQFGAGTTLPRKSKDQSKVGTKVTGALAVGDLIFFDSTDVPGREGINHVGIYITK